MVFGFSLLHGTKKAHAPHSKTKKNFSSPEAKKGRASSSPKNRCQPNSAPRNLGNVFWGFGGVRGPGIMGISRCFWQFLCAISFPRVWNRRVRASRFVWWHSPFVFLLKKNTNELYALCGHFVFAPWRAWCGSYCSLVAIGGV